MRIGEKRQNKLDCDRRARADGEVVLLLIVGMALTAAANQTVAQTPPEKGRDISTGNAPAARLKLGINRPNLVWAYGGDVAAQKSLLDRIHAAGATRVRLSLQLPYAKAIEHIRHCNHLGMDVTIWIGAGNPAFYPAGSAKRKGIPNPEGEFPLLFDQYPLADLDIAGFRSVLTAFLQDCRRRNARIEALQVFTEVNWADFNGDLPVVEGGWFLDETTPWDDPRYVAVRKGIVKCGKAIKAARSVADEVFGSGQIKILSPAMAGPPASWVRRVNGSIVDSGLYLTLLRGRHARQRGAEDYLKYADGVAVHIYPSVTDTTAETGADTALRVVRERMDPIVARVGTDLPYWVTEWGYPRYMFGTPPDESKRLRQFRYFLDAVKRYRSNEVAWGEVLLFNFDMMSEYNICDEGRLLESAKILRWQEY